MEIVFFALLHIKSMALKLTTSLFDSEPSELSVVLAIEPLLLCLGRLAVVFEELG